MTVSCCCECHDRCKGNGLCNLIDQCCSEPGKVRPQETPPPVPVAAEPQPPRSPYCKCNEAAKDSPVNRSVHRGQCMQCNNPNCPDNGKNIELWAVPDHRASHAKLAKGDRHAA